MLTKILNNNLSDRSDIQANLVKAMIGTWGIISDDSSENIYVGRTILTFIYNGTTITNSSENYKAISLIVYEDGTTDIKVIQKKETINTSKEIDIAIVMAQI